MIYTKKKIVVEMDVPDGATHYEVSYHTIRFLSVEGDMCSVPCAPGWMPTEISDAYFSKYLRPIEVIE